MLLRILIFLLFFNISIHTSVLAASDSTETISAAENHINTAISQLAKGNQADAQKEYDLYNGIWMKIEDGVKSHSTTAYRDIESNMGKAVYGLTIKKTDMAMKALTALKGNLSKFSAGGYPQEAQPNTGDFSLDDFILTLQTIKKEVAAHDQTQSLASIQKARDSWLSIEGVVVAQSATVYSDSERDMVTVQAMLSANPPDFEKSKILIDKMISYLTPLANKSQYTYWDAAMILIREGLEALLVVIALLSFVNKSGEKRGKGWIWTGILSGLGISVILALIVKFVISSGAFGNNNALIAGWTGVFAAAMLLYMSYWLHSQANIADWNRYLREKSQTALSTGKLVSLGLLAFLAVFREGTETVLFYIGMANQIDLKTLLIGFLLGAGLLGVLGYLLIFVGLKLPLRPFFSVSSLIVFYLCLKFTGMGIHSLQLAGIVPSTNAQSVPSLSFFALYPSWESAIPQFLLVIVAFMIIVIKKIRLYKAEA